MTGTDLTRLSVDIVKLVNLVAFDVLDPETCAVSDTVNPLVKYVTAAKVGQIPKEHKSELRRLIKKTCIRYDMYAGEIRLDTDFAVKVYLKRRIKPAWLSDSDSGSQPSDS